MPLTIPELHILQHALGLDEYGRGIPYRSHFVTYPDSADGKLCECLVSLGLMWRHNKMGELTGGEPCYFVTDEGRAAVKAESPAAPTPTRETRSQERYLRFLRADSGLTFREWLKAGGAR